MTFFSSLSKFFAPRHAEPRTPSSSIEPHLNLNQAAVPTVLPGEGATFLSSIERTTTLLKFLQDADHVSLDRIAGSIEIGHQGQLLKTDLLQVASEVYLKRSRSSKLYLATHSPLRSSMTTEHVGKVEALLEQAAYDGKLPRYAGLISTSPTTKPYSRLGKAPYTPLPPTIQKGDYQFFIPGPERASTVQFLTSLCDSSHVLLPAVVLNGEVAKPTSNVSVSPLWHFAALGEHIKSQLRERDPMMRFYALIFEWADFLSFSRFDLPQTVTGLAHSLGLEVASFASRFSDGPAKFTISSGNPEKDLVVHLSPADSSNRQELAIGWAKHL